MTTGFRQDALATALGRREAAEGHRANAVAHAGAGRWTAARKAREREAADLRAAAAGLRSAALAAELAAIDAESLAFAAQRNETPAS